MVKSKVALGLFLSFSLAMGYQVVKHTGSENNIQNSRLKNMSGDDVNLLAEQSLDEIILERAYKRDNSGKNTSSKSEVKSKAKIVSLKELEIKETESLKSAVWLLNSTASKGKSTNKDFKDLRTEESLRAEAWLPQNTNDNSSPKKVQKMQKIALYISNTYRIPIKNAEQIVYTTFEESAKKNLEPILVLSLIDSESGFQQHARSRVGALGLTQVMPKYHPEKIAELRKTHGIDIYSINGNIKVGTQILREYINKAGGNLQKGLQMYNGSSRDATKKYSNKIMSKMHLYSKL